MFWLILGRDLCLGVALFLSDQLLFDLGVTESRGRWVKRKAAMKSKADPSASPWLESSEVVGRGGAGHGASPNQAVSSSGPRSEFRCPGETAHLSEKSQGTFFLSSGTSEDHALIFKHASPGP